MKKCGIKECEVWKTRIFYSAFFSSALVSSVLLRLTSLWWNLISKRFLFFQESPKIFTIFEEFPRQKSWVLNFQKILRKKLTLEKNLYVFTRMKDRHTSVLLFIQQNQIIYQREAYIFVDALYFQMKFKGTYPR